MAFLSDITSEYKNAKPPEKVFIGGAIVAAIVVAFIYFRNKSAQNASQGATGVGGPTPPTGLPTWPYGSTPVTNPVTGEPIGVIGPPPPGSGGGTGSGGGDGGGGGGGFKPNLLTDFLLPKNADIGKWTANRQANYGGYTFTLSPGASGRLWGKIVGGQYAGQQVLLSPGWNQSVPANGGIAYQAGYGAPQPLKQGGGPFGTRVLAKRQARIAPSKEGQPTHTATTYARRRAMT